MQDKFEESVNGRKTDKLSYIILLNV